jgi:Zn ribbon nucleic-acid-binding protein
VTDKTPPRKGYTCPDCKTHHDFSAWVYAHWSIELTHRCDCGVKNTILKGEVIDTAKQHESQSK